MSELDLWYKCSSQQRAIRSPAWDQVNLALDDVMRHGGTLEIGFYIAGAAPRQLQLFAERGHFVLILGGETEDDYVVRTINNPDAPDSKVEICGNLWSARQVTKNSATVKEVFKEFVDDGDVSDAILQ